MGRWVTLEDAQDRTFGGEKWWECKSPSGKQVEVRQHKPGAPLNYPVWVENGTMYLGGWDGDMWNDFGVCCRRDGRVLVGHRVGGVLMGKAVRTWLASAPSWKNNKDPNSNIRSKIGLPIPYVYIGGFNELGKFDDQATVVLADGTVRQGPFADNEPVGDWWNDHKAFKISPEKVCSLLCQKEADAKRDKPEEIVIQSPRARGNAGVKPQFSDDEESCLIVKKSEKCKGTKNKGDASIEEKGCYWGECISFYDGILQEKTLPPNNWNE